MYHQDELDHLPIIGRNFQRESFQQHHHLLTAIDSLVCYIHSVRHCETIIGVQADTLQLSSDKDETEHVSNSTTANFTMNPSLNPELSSLSPINTNNAKATVHIPGSKWKSLIFSRTLQDDLPICTIDDSTLIASETDNVDAGILENVNHEKEQIKKISSTETLSSNNVGEQPKTSQKAATVKVTVKSNQKHKCSKCGNVYAQLCSLSRHRRVHKRVKKSLTCYTCKRIFYRLDSLKSHCLKQHLGTSHHSESNYDID